MHSFSRRWLKSGARELVQGLDIGPGPTLTLVHVSGTMLAILRGQGQSTPTQETLESLGSRSIGNPPIARLIGDLTTIPDRAFDSIHRIVSLVSEFDLEMEDLSAHALERYRELNLLYDFSQQSSSASDLEEILELTLRKAIALVQASGASIQTLDTENPSNCQLRSIGTVPEIGKRNVDRIIESGRPLVGMTPEVLRETEEDWLALLAAFPMQVDRRTTGVLVVMAGAGRELRPEDQRLLTTLAAFAATRIEQAHLTEATVRRRELATIGQVTSAIVHDFKNPLTAMRGFAEMIQMEHIPVQEHGVLAEQIIDNADRLWAMVEEILYFVRGNRSILELAPISGKELEARLDRLLRHGLPECIKLQIDFKDIESLVIDANKFERVIVNLVRNASEAIVERGSIEVVGTPCPQDKDRIRIEVRDDGPGIPRSIRENLFDPFVSANKSSGTGLGLAIVKKVVEEHNGSVVVDSEPGCGTSFFISLPRFPGSKGANE
jgi:signal transduction histidine kinase